MNIHVKKNIVILITQVAEGNLQTMSIGGIFKYEEDGKAIEEVDLMEISLVAIPMNPDARFIVKEASEENIEKI